jgi:predicted MFS family arabinose efflux permease
VVQGKSATNSGVQMIPMMFGIIIGSVGSGIAVSKIGKFHFFPMIGLALATIGLYLLSLLDEHKNLGKGKKFFIIFLMNFYRNWISCD